jgi:hypothetical protein
MNIMSDTKNRGLICLVSLTGLRRIQNGYNTFISIQSCSYEPSLDWDLIYLLTIIALPELMRKTQRL